MNFMPIHESTNDSTRISTPIPISRGPSSETIESYLDSFRPFTPVDRENMIKEANAKELLENIIENIEKDKTNRFAGYLEYYKKHIQDKQHEMEYLLDIYKNIDTQYHEFLKKPFVDKKRAYQDYIKTGIQELIVFIELLKTKQSIENANRLLHARGELNSNSPFNKTPDYNKLEQGLLNMEIGGKTRAKKLSVKNKTSKKKANAFFFNPSNPKTSFDVYIDKNPNDTIPIKYTTVQDVKDTVMKLEKLYKKGKYPHKRIWQVGMIMKVRLEAMLKHKDVLYPNAKNVKRRFNLANKYFLFLSKRTTLKEEDRKKLVFKF
jgi:hypothetical protein